MDKNKVLEDIVADIKATNFHFNSKLRLTDSEIDKYGTKTLSFSGGLNGFGEWTDYFEDLTALTKAISKKYRIWLINLENDCLDDLFYATFGVDLKEEAKNDE